MKWAHTAGGSGRGGILPLLAGAFLAGGCNRLLGTGGGMILFFTLSKCTRLSPKEIFATGAAVILCFSLCSAATYLLSGQITQSAFSLTLPVALAGGAVGAFLLGRIRTDLLHNLFALLLVLSGGVLLFR